MDTIQATTSNPECHKTYLVVDASGQADDANVLACDPSEAICAFKHDRKLGEGGSFIAEEVVEPCELEPCDDDDTEVIAEDSDADCPGESDDAEGCDLHGTGGANEQ